MVRAERRPTVVSLRVCLRGDDVHVTFAAQKEEIDSEQTGRQNQEGRQQQQQQERQHR